jgi:glycolate oxidase
MPIGAGRTRLKRMDHRRFCDILPADRVLAGDADHDYSHDETLGSTPVVPMAVLLPETSTEVAAILRMCDEHRIAVTARGSGTGLSGAAIPTEGGIVVSFERMKRIEIDTENQVAVVEPGVTLAELDEVTAKHDLVYPVYPGEYSASLGGNVATNAGGMRAVKYGVTRHQVLGLEAVLPTGDIIRTGGRFVKGSTGYDLTQLIVGSEGTLALVTEAILKLYPRPAHQATVLAPFATLDGVMHAVPHVVGSGIGPLILEYIDSGTLAAMVREFGLELGVPEDVREATKAYAVIMMEDRNEVRLEEDVHELALLLSELGAIDVYVLPSASGQRLIEAREKAFWIAKGAGADDIIDIVVPRASISEYMARVGEIARENGAFVAGCGHAGDGNIHLSVYKPDAEERSKLLRALFETGMAFGGVISGEHGIGTTKRKYFLELEDPVKVELMGRIKAAFDPNGIMNPGTIF